MSPEGRVPEKKMPKKEPKKLKARTKNKVATESVSPETSGHDNLPDRLAHGDSVVSEVAQQEAIALAGDDLVEQAVRFINEKANETLYVGAIEIGAYVLKHFYGDDAELASSRNPKKPISYQKLCSRPDLLVKPEGLGVMVRVAAQEKFFADHKLKVDSLTYSHKAELVKLDNDSDKIKLVKGLLKALPPVRELGEQLRKVRKKTDPERGLLGSHMLKILYAPEKLFGDDPQESLFNNGMKREEYLRRLKSKTRQGLLNKMDLAIEKAKKWVALYEGIKRDLDEIELEEKSGKS